MSEVSASDGPQIESSATETSAEPIRSTDLEPATNSGRKLAWVAMGIIVLSLLIRPGDVPWIMDEPVLIRISLWHNQLPLDVWRIRLPFTPALYGLLGTRGAFYGPLPEWYYQICLAITHNVDLLIWIRTLTVAGATAAGLMWLSRNMAVTPWLAVVVMLSPWMWLYLRQLWDNSFCIPLATLALAAYADFLVTGRGWPLRLAIVFGWMLLMVHLATIALVVPIGLHMLYEIRWVARYKWSVLAIVFAGVLISCPYLLFFKHNYHRVNVFMFSPVAGWFFPLLGAHHLTGGGLASILEDDWIQSLGGAWPVVLMVAQTFSLIAYPVVWLGMVLSARMAWKVVKSGEDLTITDHLAVIAILSVLCQSLLDGIERTYNLPHYYNPAWIVFVFFAWLGADAIKRWLWEGNVQVRIAFPVFAVSLIVVLAGFMWKIARDGGTRGTGYGTAISSQIDAVRDIAKYSPDSPRDMEVVPWRRFNNADPCDALADLINDHPQDGEPKRYLIVRYRGDPPDAHIIVEAKELQSLP